MTTRIQVGKALWIVWGAGQPPPTEHALNQPAENDKRPRRPPRTWWVEQGRLVYTANVVSVVSAAADHAEVKVELFKPVGGPSTVAQLTLTAATFCDARGVHRAKAHLSWAFKVEDAPATSSSSLQPSAVGARATPPAVQPPRAPKRKQPAGSNGSEQEVRQELQHLRGEYEDLQGRLLMLSGRMDAWEVTAARFRDYMQQQGRLTEEVRKLKSVTRVDAAPGDAAGPSACPDAASARATASSLSDPACNTCKIRVAYDMPLGRLVDVAIGPGKLNLSDLFTSGRVRANSGLKKLVQCDQCLPKGVPRLVVCTSGGAGNRITCDWCRCRMTTNTTDAITGWCGKRHSNCRQLVLENESDRQGNTMFLTKGLAPVKEVVPYDELKLIDVDLSAYNNVDYAIVASSSLGKSLILLEVDNNQHSGGGQYSPEAERAKNTGNFACGQGFDKVLFMRICPTGKCTTSTGEELAVDKKARWLVWRDWVISFLRAPWGAWTFGDKTLVYLYYNADSPLIDRRPEHTTVVAYAPPALPTPTLSDLADWACTLDPYLLVKGSQLAQQYLALLGRHPQPARD